MFRDKNEAYASHTNIHIAKKFNERIDKRQRKIGELNICIPKKETLYGCTVKTKQKHRQKSKIPLQI